MEGVNYIDEEPRWQAFDEPQSAHLPESSLMGASLDYSFRTISHSPQRAAEYRLEHYDTLAQDCILTPVSSAADLNIPLSDLTSLPWSVSYPPDFEPQSISMQSCTQEAVKGIRKERRRAQNRKAQKAFRERKDKAIQRLEGEVEKLHEANESLSTANEARLREISKLRAELEEKSPLSPSTVGNSYFERLDDPTSKRGSVSSDPMSPPSAKTPIVPVEPADVCGPFIKWRGRVYVDAESLIKQPSKECG